MKELQAGLRLVRTKCIQLNRHPVFKKKTLQPVVVESLPQKAKVYPKSLLSFPVASPPEGMRQRTTQGLRRLMLQAERINQLSAELEAAVFEFKAMAAEVNQDWKAFQTMHKATSAITDICKYQAVHIPLIQQKSSGSFVITSRTVDLFQAEREAELLAQTLRCRAKKKRHKG